MFKRDTGRLHRKTGVVVALALVPVALLLMSACRRNGCPTSSSSTCPCSGS